MRQRLVGARNCLGDQRLRQPVVRVKLPGDPPGSRGDEWRRCPWADGVIDPGALYYVQTYLDAHAEGVPLVDGPMERWTINAVDLSRIMRGAIAAARADTGSGQDRTLDRARAAAEVQRQEMVRRHTSARRAR